MTKQGSLKNKVIKGTIWVFLEKFSTQFVGFIVGMVLARLLTPTDYGVVALTAIFFSVANVLVDSGFGLALIQKKDADDLDFNSVFYLNVFLSVLAYVVFYFAAPWIADFYKAPELVKIVRVMAIMYFFTAINSIQNAELTKKMLFHLSFRISVITSLASAFFGLTFAFAGFGVWALVWSSLLTNAVGVIAKWFIIAWRPKMMFSFTRLKPLYAYGWKMCLSALLDSFFNQLNGLLIGRFYTKADLAYVNKGDGLPRLVMNQVDETVGRVAFPALVQIQDNRVQLREAMRRMMQCSTFLVFPLMVGLAACAKSELRLLYGEQWVPATPYMMLACFSFALWPLHTINLKGIMTLGRSDVFLKLEIMKKVLKLVVILLAFRHGIFVFMAASAFALGPLSLIVNAWPNKKLLDYTIGMQVRDVLPTVVICTVEAAVVFGVDFLFKILGLDFEATGSSWSLFAVLVVQFIAGAFTYLILAFTFRVRPMGEYFRVIDPLLSRKLPKISAIIRRRFA